MGLIAGPFDEQLHRAHVGSWLSATLGSMPCRPQQRTALPDPNIAATPV
jgi:hypothetical protein